MVMTGPVSEWEFWTDMVFPETGNCVVPLGLVDIDRAKDTGDGDGPGTVSPTSTLLRRGGTRTTCAVPLR